MDMDLAADDNNEEQLQLEETNSICGVDVIEIVPLAGDTDGCSTTECVSGDWSEVKEERLTVVKNEPDNVCHHCCVLMLWSNRNNLCSSLVTDEVLDVSKFFLIVLYTINVLIFYFSLVIQCLTAYLTVII